MWGLEDLFWQHFAIAGSRGAFVDDEEKDITTTDTTADNIDIVKTITMPPAFEQDAADFVASFKQYRLSYPELDYSVGNREWVGHYADRESYFCYVAWLNSLTAYMNDIDEVVTAAPLPHGTCYTLPQILSYFIENNLLIAINTNSLYDIDLHSGDVVLCRTNAGVTSDQLYGIGDMYVFDGSENTFMKWTKAGLVRTLDIEKPAIVARPLLQKYGLYAMGRLQFESYINRRWSTLDNNNIIVQAFDAYQSSDSTQSQGASGTTGSITPASGKKYIWFTLLSALNNNEYAVAGIMGNLAHESGFQSNNLQNSYNTSLGLTDAEYTSKVDNGTYTNFVNDSAGYGLAQWTYYTRKQALLDYARERSTSIGDLAMQVQFLLKELQANTVLWTQLLAADCVRDASNNILFNYERPADQSQAVQDKRTSSSQAIYDEFHGATVTEDVSLNTELTPTGNNTVVANTQDAYKASIVLQDRNGTPYPSISTQSWSTAGWDSKFTITSAFGGRQGGFHAGVDIVPKNGNWDRYTVARCKIKAVVNSQIHWLPTDSSWAYWYNESLGPSSAVPRADTNATSAGSYVKYAILDANDNEVATITEMHYVYNSIPSYVTAGAILEAGTLIGTGGNTGRSTGRHIHFQINATTGGNPALNPTSWLSALGLV